MIGLLVVCILMVLVIVGVSMLASPESYAEQRVVLALRRPLICKLTGLALILVAIAGGAASFIQFVMSNYSE
jgi:hypothetical protein